MNRAGIFVFVSLLLLAASPGQAKPKLPSSAEPRHTEMDATEIANQKGERAQRAMDAQNKRWDAEMAKISNSICRGC